MKNKERIAELKNLYNQGIIEEEEIQELWNLSKEEFTEFEEEEYLEDSEN